MQIRLISVDLNSDSFLEGLFREIAKSIDQGFRDCDVPNNPVEPEVKWHLQYVRDLEEYFSPYKLPPIRYDSKLKSPGFMIRFSKITNTPVDISINLPEHKSTVVYDKFSDDLERIGIGPNDHFDHAAFVLAHEMQHYVQYEKGWLRSGGAQQSVWKNDPAVYDVIGREDFDGYLNQPWEKDANKVAIDFCRKYGYLRD